MRCGILNVSLVALLLAACSDPPETATVAEVLVCDSGNWMWSPRCRVKLTDGRHVTAFAPVAVGDSVTRESSGAWKPTS